MNSYITVIDDFLPNPDEIRNNVIKLGFKDETFQGSTYFTVNADYKPLEIIDSLERIYKRPIKVSVSAFRQGKKDSPLHNLVHADNSCSSMAGVLYLNKPEDCFGGTAFWQHKATGWFEQPSGDDMAARGIDLKTFGEDWHRPEVWNLSTVIGMRYNRMILYPTSLFHSRWPWEGFGETEDTARLIHASFFDVM